MSVPDTIFSPLRTWRLLYWYNRSFQSREHTMQLLTPDRNSGTLTPADFDKSVEFLPNKYHNAKLVLHLLSGVALSALLVTYTKKRLPSYLVGATYGGISYATEDMNRISAHYKFEKSLENPTGFAQAMENIQIRQGAVRGDHYLFTDLRAEFERKNREIHGRIKCSREDSSYHNSDPTWADLGEQRGGVRNEDWVVSSESDKIDQAMPGPTSPQKPVVIASNRWDEIRAANSRSTAQNSSWDVLRQNHERRRVSGSDSGASPGQDIAGYDRIAEQARFDTVLEAERRKGMS